MKLLVFLIIVAVLLFLAIQIKVVNYESMTTKEKKILADRNKLRTMLSSNYVKADESDKKEPEKIESFRIIPQTVSARSTKNRSRIENIIQKIRFSELKEVDFNQANCPITNRNPILNPKETDYLLRGIVLDNLEIYNKKYFQNHLEISEIRLVKSTEADDQSLVMIISKLRFTDKIFYLKLIYHCQWTFSDEILNSIGPDVELNLVKIESINQQQYQKFLAELKVENKPFMTMEEQMDYVSYINQLHREEME